MANQTKLHTAGFMSAAAPTFTSAGNLLLAALPSAARLGLVAHAHTVTLTPGSILCEPGADILHVYFPIDSIVARVAGARGGAGLEAGLVGNEGMLGVTLMLGVPASPSRWLVQREGRAWRFEAATFLLQMGASPLLRRVLDRYLYVTLVQLTQTAACKRFHVVEARLARWLLMTRDRAHASGFHATHEGLAQLMGVRRAGITRAAGCLQQRRIIDYSRGELRILDVRALEAASCACYRADKDVYAKVMR